MKNPTEINKAKKLKELDAAIKKMKAENAREFGDYRPKGLLFSLKNQFKKK